MTPTYQPGQYIIASSLPLPKANSVVIATYEQSEVIKRVEKGSNYDIYLKGDNGNNHHNAVVAYSDIIGVVL